MEKERFFSNLIKIIVIILGISCFYLQIIRYKYYLQLSLKNCIRTIETGTPRGTIYDRNNKVLAKDKPTLNLVFIPFDLKYPEKEAEILSKIITIDKNYIIKKFKKEYLNPYDRIIIKRNLSTEEISLIEENLDNLPGIFAQEGISREYPLGEKTSHVIGYLGEVSKDELDSLGNNKYKPGDFIGKDGIEKYYDMVLRGTPGGIQVEVDALGHHRKIRGRKLGKEGNSLVLTIDRVIQEVAYKHLGKRSGCVVAMDPRNGEILALVSSPSFNPERVEKYINLANHPLFNRVIKGQYPPGSVFKIITEIAALETDAVDEYDRIECLGTIEVGDRVFHCWKEEGHGWIDINLALPFSCNIFFGACGMRVGVKKILEYAGSFGFGEKTGIDLYGEKNGYLPTEYEIDPLNLAIGQGAILATPIQLLSLISTIANGGNIWKPFIVKKIVSPEGTLVKEISPFIKKTIYINSETLDILKKGLRNVVLFGTGHLAEVEGLEICGKTGTAQRAGRENELPTYGAFVCYSPSKDPKIAMVVFIDYGSSAEAASIAGKILKEVFIPEEGRIGEEKIEEEKIGEEENEEH